MAGNDPFDEFGQNELQVAKALAQIPGIDTRGAVVEWLCGGGAHKNFLVTTSGRRIVLKLWNTMWEGVGVISPAPVVMQNTIIAGELGIGAPVLAVIPDPLALAVEFLPSCRPLEPTGEQWLTRLASAANSRCSRRRPSRSSCAPTSG